MSRTFWLFAAGLVSMVVGLDPAKTSGGERVGPIEVQVLPLPSADGRSGRAWGIDHGYTEYRVQLKNHSQLEQVVHLSYPQIENAWDNHGVLAMRTVHAAQGQQLLVSLYQPPERVARRVLTVQVQGQGPPTGIPVASLYEPRYHYRPDDRRAAVLLSRGVPLEFRDGMGIRPLEKESGSSSESAPRSGETEDDRFTFLRSELPVGQWSPNWLGYSGFDVVVVTEQDVAQMPPEVQLALRRYLECGGTLVVHAKQVPAPFAQGGFADRDGVYAVGLGFAVATLRGSRADWGATYTKLTELPKERYQPLDAPPNNLYGLLVAETVVPVRGLFLLVLLFSVGIGPANLWLLSRYKRRVWLWWNVPALALLTCLVIFGYSLVSEGWTGHGRTASVTLLDERSHRATTFGCISYYCPLTPASGPHFSQDTDATLLTERQDMFGPRLASGLRVVDWTGDQHLASGWVNARSAAYFQFRKNEDRRERLTITQQADGGLAVLNALGADIQRLYVADAAGHVFEGRGIPAGAQRPLAATEVRPESRRPTTYVRELFYHQGLLAGLNAAGHESSPGAKLAPGTYIAYLQRSPFVGASLAGTESEDSLAIVYGICKEQEDGR